LVRHEQQEIAMRSRVVAGSEITKKFLAKLVASASLGLLVLSVSSLADTRTAAASAAVSPGTVAFGAQQVGKITYRVVTITNTGSSSETLASAAVDPSPAFWPTWGGTCNVQYLYVIPPGASCTFQFGFEPTRKGHVSGQGTITFQSGNTLTVQLSGVGH
jgi:Abnormal spindle-like microcephaly-assoc'd, ASPM-SPD-2-Hydin